MDTVFSTLTPTDTGDGNFVWNELDVRASSQSGGTSGNGVYARMKISKGTFIPIFGLPVANWETYSHMQSHGWEKRRGRQGGKLLLDGHPSHFPHGGVGYFGLAIGMMVNEPSGLQAPNCIFRLNSVLVQEDLEAGVELTVHYGDGYPRPYEYQQTVLGNPLRKRVDNALLEELARQPSIRGKIRHVFQEYTGTINRATRW
jgi:hypothetical protein